MPPPILPDDLLDWATEQLRAQRRLADVAADLGVHPDTVRQALARRGLTVAGVKLEGRSPDPAERAQLRRVLSIKLAPYEDRVLRAYAAAQNVAISAVIAAALRRVGITDPTRTAPVDLGFRPPRRTAPSDPHVVGRVDRRRRRLRQIVAERGWPSGRAVDDVAAELGIHRRTAYGDLAAIAREARSRDDAAAPSAT